MTASGFVIHFPPKIAVEKFDFGMVSSQVVLKFLMRDFSITSVSILILSHIELPKIIPYLI
jgi:hypothetical protein